MTDTMNYDQSPIPSRTPGGPAGERNPDRSIGVDERGNLNYASAAAEGMVEIVLPALPGSPNGEERMLAKDFSVRVAGEVERSMKRNPYLRSGPQQSPAQTFRHYVAVAKGSRLMDAGTISRMEKMAGEFEVEPNQQDYFELVLKPYLHGLKPTRRR